MEKGQGAVILILVFTVVIVAAICAASGAALVTDPSTGAFNIGKPEDFARATGVARAADLAQVGTIEAIHYKATQNAANGQATATAAAVQVQATATAFAQAAQVQATEQAQNAQATATVQAGVAGTEVNTRNVNAWSYTLLGVIGGGLAALAIAFAFAAWLRTRAKVAWVGPNGPVLVIGNTVIDMGKAVGPAVTVAPNDKLIELARVQHYLTTGQIIAPPLTTIQLTDAGASADHLLAAAQANSHTNAMGAMFRPDNAWRGREEKLETLEKRQAALPQHSAPELPRLRIINDPNQVDSFVRLLESSNE